MQRNNHMYRTKPVTTEIGGKNMPEITYLDTPMDTDALMDKLCPRPQLVQG